MAACLLADPELLLLDEPMNGLDPAGMHEMREMIRGFVGEGRTVVLSSHLLDEVERTCDAVAIVDRGRVIRQGPISELVRGASGMVVRIESSDAMAAARVVGESGLVAQTTLTNDGLSWRSHRGQPKTSGEINRRLVESGISVYRIEPVRASLEEWFLSVTSRFGGDSRDDQRNGRARRGAAETGGAQALDPQRRPICARAPWRGSPPGHLSLPSWSTCGSDAG